MNSNTVGRTGDPLSKIHTLKCRRLVARPKIRNVPSAGIRIISLRLKRPVRVGTKALSVVIRCGTNVTFVTPRYVGRRVDKAS